MTLTDLYQIDEKPFVVPDAGVVMTVSQVDAGESGMDEAGFFHRKLLRDRLGAWQFTYSRLSREEYAYMQSLLPQKGTFVFVRPGQNGAEHSLCCLKDYTVKLHSAKTGVFTDLKFTVTEC